MKNLEMPKTIYLRDYQVPNFLIQSTDLNFDLQEEFTIVKSELQMERNPAAKNPSAALVLHGADLELLEVSIDGKKLSAKEYTVGKEELELHYALPEKFIFSATTKIYPQKNTSLEGLYKSSGMFCTQCESEGFRKITYFLDRPDSMSLFTTSITADKKTYPILLSNGNKVAAKDLSDGKHWVKWEDPFRKPAYLFALVAGDLDVNRDTFRTRSGREVKLEIFVNKGNVDRTGHAMDSLKKCMKWDEDTYGLEYDLDIFMIVAVDDFNFGAMENKGLNIFNSSLVLARADTATDSDFEAIEAVVGHEYFHNWTGNRVTCRDWFQISLKEGLTVYRDQEFTADMMSRAVKRIDDVNMLRTHQFAEDAGPMAHPIRPASYMEINNFYTLTVYEKGAEVIRMIATILGKDGFQRGIKKYFELFDGQAVTTDDFVFAMEQASGVDLKQFRESWYSQAGTPNLKIQTELKGTDLHVRIAQSCAPSPGQPEKMPYHIPLAVAVFSGSGKLLTEKLLQVKKAQEEFVLSGVDKDFVFSPLRNFSAPVTIAYKSTPTDLEFLLKNETDSFARWEASQTLAKEALLQKIALAQGESVSSQPVNQLPEIFRHLLKKVNDPALLSQILSLPSEKYLAQQLAVVDMQKVASARDDYEAQIGLHAWQELMAVYEQFAQQGDYRYTAQDVGRRLLKNVALSYLVASGKTDAYALARKQYFSANNMTDMLSAYAALSHVDHSFREEVSQDFYQKWKHDGLVINKWLGTEASSRASGALARVNQLIKDPAFNIGNPNKVRAVIAMYAGYNPAFHDLDGSGYSFLAEKITEIDPKNPSLAARLAGVFNPWKKYDSQRKALIKGVLQGLEAKSGLSTGTYEIVSKALQG